MSDYYLGEIRIFAGGFAPEDWALCDGRLLQINSYQPLYALLGTTWGGDGKTTFGLPDLRGRLPIGQGQGVAPNGSPPMTMRTLGQTGGAETVTVTEAQYPTHTHTLNVALTPATAATPGSTLAFAQPGGGNVTYLPNPKVNPDAKFSITLDPGTVAPSTGGSQPHNNIMPCLAVNFIICIKNGLFPSRP